MRATLIPRTLAAVVLVSSLALAGCSSESTKEDRGPLDPYYRALWGVDQWNADKERADHLKREEVISACMKDQGFEYVPQPWNDGGVDTPAVEAPDDDGPEWGTTAFAEKYGYGIVEWPGMDEELAAESEPEAPKWVDPNQDYINTLSQPEQMAYYGALYGKRDNIGQEMDEDGNLIEHDVDWSSAGCSGKAMNEVTGQQPWRDPEFSDLVDEFDALYQSIESGDEMTALNREWADCVMGKGFTFANPNEASEHMYDLSLDELYPRGTDEPTQEVKDAFRAKEIEQAVADFSCQEKVSYGDKVTEITFALQQKFVDEHKAQLDALLKKYGAENQEKE